MVRPPADADDAAPLAAPLAATPDGGARIARALVGRWRRAVAGLGLALGLGASACRAGLTELVVVVDSDLDVPGAIDQVIVTVTGPASADARTSSVDLTQAGAPRRPWTLSLAPLGPGLGPVRVSTVAMHAGSPVLEQSAVVAFVGGERRALRVDLARRCVPIRCASGTSCRDGVCVAPELAPAALPEWHESATCVATSERCNGRDDDCDDVADEDFDLRSDTAHCGACERVCGAGLACADGVCAVAPVTAISAGANHACAVRASGAVLCWGSGRAGQLGEAGVSARAVPRAVADVAQAVEVRAGVAHACARSGAGGVLCWGDAADGLMGNETVAQAAVPRAVAGLSEVVEIAVGLRHTCARRRDGRVWCWGGNQFGQLGDGTMGAERTQPRPVTGLVDATQLSATANYTCARRATGAVVCWGANTAGQFGVGRVGLEPTPVEVVGLSDAVEVAAGEQHACARRASGLVVCWGANERGQLGDGTVSAPRTMPGASVAGISDAVQITAGEGHTCARRAVGVLRCWGANAAGQLGNGNRAAQSRPVLAEGLVGVAEVSAGENFTCARTASPSALWCWGANDEGHLGDGGFALRELPARVVGID